MSTSQLYAADHAAAIADLIAWGELTGRPLPYPPEVIVRMESIGQVVDLADGSISWAADDRIVATAAGLALVAEVRQ